MDCRRWSGGCGLGGVIPGSGGSLRRLGAGVGEVVRIQRICSASMKAISMDCS